MPRIYIAGPMTGIPEFNAPAFDKMEKDLRSLGWDVINPIALDRSWGDTYKAERKSGIWLSPMRDVYLKRDLGELLNMIRPVDAICMLAGWEASDGAILEHHVAQGIGLKVFYQAGRAGVLGTAMALVHGPRNRAYGHPIEDFTRTAELATAIGFRRRSVPAPGVASKITAEDVALFMLCVKLSRLAHDVSHRDSLVDIAGYAETLAMVLEKRCAQNSSLPFPTSTYHDTTAGP